MREARPLSFLDLPRISFHVYLNQTVVDHSGPPSFWRQAILVLQPTRYVVVLGFSTRSATCVRVVLATNEKMQRPVGGPLWPFYARHVADTHAKRGFRSAHFRSETPRWGRV